MNRFVCCLLLGCSWFTANAIHAENSPHEFSANVSILSDYLYRGISQTNENFALQGGLDYAHSTTGLYVGVCF
jgi:uncharacterized protein (TIGR02001 family)